MSPTYFGLLAEFGAAEIRLEDCCEKYFSMSTPFAKRQAMMQKLPVKAYRATRSQKAGWLIDAKDLAEHLDRQKADAAREHSVMNAASDFRAAG